MTAINTLQHLLARQTPLEFSVLVGSRVTGNTHAASDWDIAIHWNPSQPWLERVAQTETLRRAIARELQLPESQIDLIDLADSPLAMRALVTEERRVLTGEDSNAWARFLRRTWRELEDFYWARDHAA